MYQSYLRYDPVKVKTTDLKVAAVNQQKKKEQYLKNVCIKWVVINGN